MDILNNFIKNDFFDFYLDKKTDSCKIKNSKNQIIGLCFKLNNFNNINNMNNINNKIKLIRNIKEKTKNLDLGNKNNIQNWRKELKTIDSNLLKKIILIQSIFRGRFIRKTLYYLLYLNYLYMCFFKKITKAILSNLSPYIFKKLFEPFKIKENKILLDDIRQYHLTFLIKLHYFENKLRFTIKNSLKQNANKIIIDTGYIINQKIINYYKEFYDSENLKKLFNQNHALININEKYNNFNDEITEYQTNNLIKEAINSFPNSYIQKIQEKDNFDFLSHLNCKELYQPIINFHQMDNKSYFFENCNLLNESLGKHLLY